MVNCKDVTDKLKKLAPPELAESWDNVGLLVGDMNKEVKNIMVSLDVTSQVINEAVKKNVDLIISHHPFIFKPLKKINTSSTIGNMVIKLIKNDISAYAMHTNLDIVNGGLNDLLAQKLNLQNVKILDVIRRKSLKKVVVFVPEGYEDKVREAMTYGGAGYIGNYSDCCFMTNGIGTFKPLEGTNPFIGEKNKLEKTKEYRLETIVPEEKLNKVINAMIKAHPYEEVAYDIYPVEIKGEAIGMGRIGELEKPMFFKEFIKVIKYCLDIKYVKYVGNEDKTVSKIALCTGSGAEFIDTAIKSKADVYITGDVKYHSAQSAERAGLNLIDAGHFETENIVVPFLVNYLKDIFKDDINIFSSSVHSNILKTI